MPVAVPNDYTPSQSAKYITDNYGEKANTLNIDPVKSEWREKAIMAIRLLIESVERAKFAHFGRSEQVDLGKLIVKKMPTEMELRMLGFSEVKFIAETAWRAWELVSLSDYLFFCNKVKQIKLRSSQLILGDETYEKLG